MMGRRFLIRLGVVLALATVPVTGLIFGGIALGTVAERTLIYPFDTTRVEPSDVGLAEVEERVVKHGEDEIIVWVAAPAPGKPVIFYLHGNASNLAARAGRFRQFLDRGYGLVAPAYPGSSGSGGEVSEEAIVAAVGGVWRKVDGLIGPANGDGSSSPARVLYGESLGTAVAIALKSSVASDAVKGVGPPAAMILEAPFTSIADLADIHYPGTRKIAELMDNQWKSVLSADRITVPLVIFHGTEDTLIPVEMGRRVFDATSSVDKTFIEVTGAGHNDLWRTDVLPQLWAFVDRVAESK